MKLNKIFTLATLATTLFFATSCSDEYSYDGRGAWDADANYANLYFPITSSEDMVDPADNPTKIIELWRRNTSGALTIPVKIIENTDDVFQVSDAVFADGDSVATITIDYSKAGVGTAYTLRLELEGSEYVSSYSEDISYTYTVTRVKWNLLGKGSFAENFWYEGENEVEIYQRDDVPTRFRIMNPFNDMTIDDGVDYADGTQSEYVEINILQKGETLSGVSVTATDLVYFTPINTGYYHPTYGEYVWLYHPAHFASLANEEAWAYNKVISWQEPDDKNNVLPGRIQLAPYYYIPGVGGWNHTTDDDMVVITFPGYVEVYVASIEDYDFSELLFAGEYISEQLGTKKNGVEIYKGVPKEDVEAANEGCFERFVETYGGTPYIIKSPYANGYDLVFLVNEEGKILPMVDYKLQATGLTALSNDVYAAIQSSGSKFTEKEISLSIKFQTKPDNQGNYVDYGTATETLANISWTKVGTGTYTYDFYAWWYFTEDDDDEYDPIVDEGYTIFQRDDDNSIYKIEDWNEGAELIFKWNKETNNCVVYEAATGISHPSVGMFYASDVAEYFANPAYYNNYPCTYDPETQTFNFNLIYYYSSNYFGVFEESLEVDWSTTAAAKAYKKLSATKATPKTLKRLKSGRELKGSRTKARTASRFTNGTKKTNAKNIKVLNTPPVAPMFVK